MFYHLGWYRHSGYVYIRASGLWNVELALRFRKDMKMVGAWAASTDLPVKFLTDLTELQVHPQDVAPIIGDASQIISSIKVSQYAMIVPGTLMRMQVRRLDPFEQRHYFDDAPSGAEWLGWDDFRPVNGGDPKGSFPPR